LNCNYCGELNKLNKHLFTDAITEIRESKQPCLICKNKLNGYSLGEGVRLEYCITCDGIFITEEHLESLIEQYQMQKSESNPQIVRFIHDHPRDNRKKAQYHPCPVCQKMMKRINYKRDSGVILDCCEEHGIWIDGGELMQIMEWRSVKTGSIFL
jgi:Zn-finger nucleic acid-binding protein